MLQVSKEATSVMTKMGEKRENAAESQAEAAGTDDNIDKSTGDRTDQHANQILKADQKTEQMIKHNVEHRAEQRVAQKVEQKTKKKAHRDEQVPITMGSCFVSEYGYVVGFLVVLILGLMVALFFQHKTNLKLSAKIRGLRAKLRADRYLINADERKLRTEKELLREEQRRLINVIHDRGNIFFDPELRQIVLKRTIPFEPVVRTEGVQYFMALARFVDPHAALMVLSDVAEVCQILPFACFLIEGHTLQGGHIDEIDEFAHEVADARALLVKESLLAFGVPAERLEALGLPGILGNNRAEVLLKLVN